MRDLVISGYVISNVGLKRPKNEDNYLLNELINETSQYISEAALIKGKKNKQWQWAGIFDGMGGGDRGEVASLIAAEELRSCLQKCSSNASEADMQQIVRQGYLNANRRIVEERKTHAILGTTATVLCFHENRAKVFHLGTAGHICCGKGVFISLQRIRRLQH